MNSGYLKTWKYFTLYRFNFSHIARYFLKAISYDISPLSTNPMDFYIYCLFFIIQLIVLKQNLVHLTYFDAFLIIFYMGFICIFCILLINCYYYMRSCYKLFLSIFAILFYSYIFYFSVLLRQYFSQYPFMFRNPSWMTVIYLYLIEKAVLLWYWKDYFFIFEDQFLSVS